MRDLEARRKALAAEAEVYRQTIKLELQNIRLYSRQTKRKFTTVRPSNPLFIALIPLLTSLLRRTGPVRKFRFLSAALVAWQMFNRFAPLLPGVIAAVKSWQ